MKKIALILTCEHAVDTVPEKYASLFAPYNDLLSSHRGIDFGALKLAKYLAQQLSCDFFQANCTRLLIDCNRSLGRRCFSEVSQVLSPQDKQDIINQYYQPFRLSVMDCIQQHSEQGFKVWHLSIHSFTPVFNHQIRKADIGLLYDPQRPSEKTLAQLWKKAIKKQDPAYKIRMNYPYAGISDGFTSALRKRYSDEQYLGLEVESNQALTQDSQALDKLKNIFSSSLITIRNNL